MEQPEDIKIKKFNETFLEKFKDSFDITVNYSLDDLKKKITEVYKSCKSKGKSKKVNEDGSTPEKRKPTLYNLFIKEKMQFLKEQNPKMDNKQIMSEAALLWKKHKEEHP